MLNHVRIKHYLLLEQDITFIIRACHISYLQNFYSQNLAQLVFLCMSVEEQFSRPSQSLK